MGGLVDGFDAAFDRGADLAVISDADSPLTLHEQIERCVGVGFEHDITLGPTDDGGYYVVTSRREARSRLASLLLGTRFESATICVATAERARLLDLSVGFGPRGADVDTGDELDALAQLLDRAPASALPWTRSALASVRAAHPVASRD
jgi:glycosyltransferase A (GT-A) superfamily protein (DUF2064 family)